MSLLSASVLFSLVRVVEKGLCAKARCVSEGRRLGAVGMAVALMGGVAIPGIELVGAGTAHAQQYEIAKLLAGDGAANDDFGASVSFSGDTAVIGARGDDDNGNASGSAYIFTRNGGVWTQQAKLLAGDGAGGDIFGSVSIDGDTAVIGASRDDDNGNSSGSAYVFTRSGGVWTQQAKLLPDDGAVGDHFGLSVSLSGNTAVIGARQDDTSGERSGTAYVFTLNGGVWTQQAKLLAGDGAGGDAFGESVSFSGDTAVIGARGDDDNGNSSGSAYVFTRIGGVWTQQAKLLPGDGGGAGHVFGRSVSIDGDTAVIGASWDDDNGELSGSAYIFSRSGSVWTQQAKLLPDDGAAGDFFGHSVSLSGDTAVIGAWFDDDDGDASGSAYVFTRSGGVWTQEIKLLAGNGAADDTFGVSVSLSGGTAVIGAVGDDDNGFQSGSAYVYQLDTDGDGLLDDWETNGIPYTDSNGIERRYMLPDADPMHKDLYVEVDAMTGFDLSNAVVEKLENAYAAAPLTNPDGVTGITLHILRDQTDLAHIAVWDTDGCWPENFYLWRFFHFGTEDEGDDPDYMLKLEAKAKAYRYCIIADTADNPNTPQEIEAIGGCGERPGDNFVLFFGSVGASMGGTADENRAAVFMHELGHNLGLMHGGGDSVNGKPNYPSIMNYVMTYKLNWNKDFWVLDYSREDAGNFVSLNETDLDETVGVGTPSGYYANYEMPFGINVLDGGNTVRRVGHVRLDGSKTDFGDTAGTMFLDGSHDTGVEQDLNYAASGPGVPHGFPGKASFPQELHPYDDWANVSLPLAATLGDGAPAPSFPTDELTEDVIVWIDENFPPPPGSCPADLNGDGVVNTQDFLAFLGAWSAGDPLADWNDDGDVNTLDFLAYLGDWTAGCP